MADLNKIIEEGFDVTFEAHRHMEDDEEPPNKAKWYCNLFYGDSNGPWKQGTKLGVGYGMTQMQAFDQAISKMTVRDADKNTQPFKWER